ncbi:KAP P-loop domain protein [Gloeothece citriformis PCC 7424]|uniref:KAP P-loop domain protein n=1 Tax=Gloeothece citriformis (strain PCC 7424) TaxID=65393 RepID=B7K6U9_GLOC7|nr:P-loop NTPase fold protein [Gloeothece citriformis]ACK72648.1 KAP P-loop domain protein [Gloeothece citriformis PCC 7424]
MSNTEELKQLIVTYVNSKNTGYAIMINGEWGAGKTYFWKTVIEPYLTDIDKKTVYISLYGLDNLEQIINLISLELLPSYKNELTQAADSALNITLKFLNIDPGIKDKAVDLLREQKLSKNLSNFVLCFDDLERSSLNIQEIFGYINQFVEHYHFKTILICNEKEFKIKNSDYQQTKEKLIAYTFYFNPSLEERVNQLIQLTEHQEDFREYADLIISLIKASDTYNLRLIKIAFVIANTVFTYLKEFKEYENLPDTIKPEILIFIFSVNLEFRKGEADLNQLEQWVIKGYDFTDSILTQESTYLSKFIKQYYSQSNLVIPTPFLSIYNYLIKGYFNLDLFYQELDKFKGKHPSLKILFLEDIKLLSDEEFYQTAQDYLDELHSDQINQPILLIKLSNKLIKFSEMGLYNLSAEKIYNIFKDSIKRLEENSQLQYQDLKNEPFLFYHEPKSQYYHDFKEIIIEANTKIYQKQVTEKANKLINLLKNDPKIFFTEVQQYNDIPLFQSFDISQLFHLIINLKNQYIYQFYLL